MNFFGNKKISEEKQYRESQIKIMRKCAEEIVQLCDRILER